MRLSLCALVLFAGNISADPPDVAVNIVNYDGLSATIKKQIGRVVVVDFWADFCVPCKREFPNLVALHAKYAAAGLTCLSVSLDDPSEEGVRERVLRFLRGQRATCVNLILDERPAVWQAKLKIDGPPIVFVFDRKGELEQKFIDKDVDYAAIEKLVVELLKK